MNRNTKTATVIVEVLDTTGSPVRSAMVQRVGYRLKETLASAYGVPEGDLWPTPSPTPTDTEGRTTLVYPLEGEEGMRLAVLFVEVAHPDFCRTPIELSVTSPTPLVLQRGARLTLIGESETKDLRVHADLGVARFLPPMDWVRSSTDTVTARLPAGRYAVRAIGLGSTDEVLFSAPQEFRAENQTATLRLALTPGRSVAGALDSSVPRPVQHGIVVAEVTTPSAAGINLWKTSAPLAEDGTFLLTSLPPGDLALVVVCDGFLSQPTEADSRSWKPQIFPADTPSPLRVQMTPSGTARIQVLGPDHAPLNGAIVLFSPNQQFQSGNTILGSCAGTAEAFEKGEAPKPALNNRYQVQTDAAGIALIPNLPPGQQIFYVHHADYEMPIAFVPSYPVRDARIEIMAGAVVEQTVTMEKAGTRSLVREIEKYEAALQHKR